MNTEKQLQLVTFEQGERLRALGFDWGTSAYWWHNPIDREWCFRETPNLLTKNNPKFDNEIAAPAVALALEWVREEKGLHGMVDCNASGWFWIICKVNGTFIKDWGDEGDDENSGCFTTHKAAQLVLLTEILILLEKEK